MLLLLLQYQKMKKRIRIAVVGTGQFGALHARAISQMPEAEVTALVDVNDESARQLGNTLGVKAIASSLDVVIDQGLADAVIIATRADTHLMLAEKVACAGLAVLVEKPLAHHAADIRAFQEKLKGNPSVVMVDHLCLFHSLIIPFMKRLDETGFRALNFTRHRPESVGRKFCEDHPVQLLMVHDLYVAAQIMKGEDPVKFRSTESRNTSGRVDMSWVELQWADGRIATFQCHTMLPEGAPADGWDRLEVFGNNFYSELTTNPAPWQWMDEKVQWPVNLEIHDSGGMFVTMLRAFLQAVTDGQVPRGCRVEDALQVQDWIERLTLNT